MFVLLRRSVLAIVAGGLSAAAQSANERLAPGLASYTARPMTPDGRAQLLRHFTPAAGPLERYAGRPGAWYALLLAPMAPRWPVQLLLWSTEHGHEVQLLALDAAPDNAPSVVYPLPLETEASRTGMPPRYSSHFMLPAASVAPAIYVLVELWRIDGRAPAPLWAQLQTQRAPRRASTPWWDATAPDAGHRARGAVPPPSPLTQQRRGSAAHEVPILGVRLRQDGEVWR